MSDREETVWQRHQRWMRNYQWNLQWLAQPGNYSGRGDCIERLAQEYADADTAEGRDRGKED